MTEAEAFTLYQMLKARGEEVHYIDRNSSAFKRAYRHNLLSCERTGIRSGIQVFRDIENPMQNQAKYICATRALHELYMYQITE